MYEFKDSLETITAQLTSPDTEHDVHKTRYILRKALQWSSGYDCANGTLLPYVVKLLANSDMVVKKLAAWYVLQHSGQENLVLLAVNTLLKDCLDPNPMVRSLALHTLASFPSSNLAQYAVTPLITALQDNSAHVRRTAILGCAKVWNIQTDMLAGEGVVDKLYAMIRDPDPLVVVNSLSALDEILREEGGVVVNKNIAGFLLNQLDKFTDWGIVTVFHTLSKYIPLSEDEIFDIMNIADKYLRHQNNSVVLSCTKYFILLVKNMPHLNVEILRRAKPQMIQSLGSGNAEICNLLLSFIASVLDKQNIFQENYQSFFCKYSEPLDVKIKKLNLLPHMVTTENVSEVLEELSLYCCDLNAVLSKHAIDAVGQISIQHQQYHTVCLQQLIDLLHMNIDYVTTNVLQVLKFLDLREDKNLPLLLELIPHCLNTVTCAEGKCAIWHLVGEYGVMYTNTPYMLEAAVKTVGAEPSAEVHLELLTACMKLFCLRPAEVQDSLALLLHVLSKCGNYDVEDRAHWYYNLLQADIQLAYQLIKDK